MRSSAELSSLVRGARSGMLGFPLLTEASSQGWAMRSICKAVMYPKTMRDCEARAIFCTRPPYLPWAERILQTW